MDTIPEVYNFQVNGISLGSGFVQKGVLNGICVGGGLISKLNGIGVGVVNLMDRANGLVIGAFGNAIAEMQGLGIGVINHVGFRMRGVQVALFGNAVSNGRILEDSLLNKERGLIGLQVGPLNNVSYSALGMQIGFLNGVDGKLEGIQIGLLNGCSSLRGAQIGLLNFCEGKLLPFLRVKLKDRRLTTSEPSSGSLP